MEENVLPMDFDVVIVGGGAAGLLAAARLALSRPKARIAILEKENTLGGRLRSTNEHTGLFSYGLNAASEQLYQFWCQTLLGEHAEEDKPDSSPAQIRQHRLGVLSGNKISELAIKDWFSPQGAKLLGGGAAAREWGEMAEGILAIAEKSSTDQSSESSGQTKINEPADSSLDKKVKKVSEDQEEVDSGDPDDAIEQSVSQAWKGPRKSALGEVLEYFALALGIPDLWSASTRALAERAQYFTSQLYSGPTWQDAIEKLIHRDWFQKRVQVFTHTRVVGADYQNDTWSLDTDVGSIKCQSLVVAQPPWQAVAWLKRSLWPSTLLHLASKTKPVSVVVLSERVQNAELDIPDLMIVPSENAQIIRNAPGEISFQATIDFELSMQAPAVVKAVRALKRARKKLLTLYPDAISEVNHIALIPIAWPQPPTQSERRWVKRACKKNFSSSSLAFCGDAYGESFDGDTNLIHSLLSACDAIIPSIPLERD